MEIGLFILIGMGIAWYLYYDAQKSVTKEATREASHMNLQAIEYQLEKFEKELKAVGILGKKDRALMDAIHIRRSDLLRHQRQESGTQQ
jgi:hypothetical protein